MPPPSTTTPQPPIQILPATTADIPSLADIHVAAFQSDLAVQLMFTDAQQHLAVTSMLEAQIPSAESIIVKAIDPTNGDILGWQGCVYMNDDDDDTNDSATKNNENVTNLDKIADAGLQKQQQTHGNESTSSTTTTTSDTGAFPINPALRTYISTDGAATRKQFMRTRGRFLLLNTLVVSPTHEHRGVGSALVRWAAATADRQDIPSWLQSSPVAAAVYGGAGGFRGVRDLDVDLSEYAPGGKGAMRGWGGYRFRYMLRDAGGRGGPSGEVVTQR
ncbi:MAG: hypothetical protein OHK93_002321 [Ramalina farinacea]|uniref:N-acetyltransferase domain-containing protein n=1 Tax=Ramalina farinacea TaxID=258253 RepID=A0AA43TYM0_9LECA|nr:hypothetical protein [Ramalina farinacea]